MKSLVPLSTKLLERGLLPDVVLSTGDTRAIASEAIG